MWVAWILGPQGSHVLVITSVDILFELTGSSGSEVKASAWNSGDPGSIPGLGRSPGEGNGNHSSILAWRIPWREEPGRLQSMGSQRVGHDFTFTFSSVLGWARNLVLWELT